MSCLRSSAIILALLVSGCDATYPSPPEPSILAVRVFYTTPMTEVVTTSACRFNAYAIRSDGAYVDVTSVANWASSDPQVLRPVAPAGTFSAVSAGLVQVVVQHQSMSGSLPVTIVRSDRITYPRLVVSGGNPVQVGKTAPISVVLRRSATSAESVSHLVTWHSANPAVVRVEGTTVTAVGVGTTTLWTSYEGLTVDYGLSVHPRAS